MSNERAQLVAAKLLRADREAHEGSRAEGLRSVMRKIDQFLVDAASAAPPQCIEMDDDESLREATEGAPPQPPVSTSSLVGAGEYEVQLTVAAGVFEERRSQLHHHGGVALPTEANRALLDEERMKDSQALLHLFSSLVAAPTNSGDAAAPRAGDHRDHDDTASSSSSSECVYMNASSCSDDSDKPPPAKKKLIEELT